MEPQAKSAAAVMDSAWPDIAKVVGAGHVRDASVSDAVAGVAVAKVIEPGTPEEVAAVLKTASAAGLALIPRGGGTKLEWGNAPKRADAILSLARLDQVEEHAWADMTATLGAGCTVQQAQQTLAQHGQRIAMEPLWPERATIGGVLAANDTGAIRARFGGLRDLVIGVTLALPDGTLAKSGGKVVKNVAGYDLPKLATGSLGTLGVVVKAVFRLHPIFPAARTMSFVVDSFEAANKLILATHDSTLVPTGLQMVARSGAPVRVDARFEGIEAGVDAQFQQFAKYAAGAQSATAPADCWKREALWQGSEPAMVVKFSVQPKQLSSFCSQVKQAAANLQWSIIAHGIGLGWLRIEGTAAPLVQLLKGLRAAVEPLGGSIVVLHCPADVRQAIDMWGDAGDAVALMQRIKSQFDPKATLNPGRFVGGI